MIVLSKIYTRTGDDGTTALGSGRRVAKYDLRVEAYGTLDETNAAIGVAHLHTRDRHAVLDAMLARIQNDLFDLGADLCYPEESKDARGRLQVTDTHNGLRAMTRRGAAAIRLPACADGCVQPARSGLGAAGLSLGCDPRRRLHLAARADAAPKLHLFGQLKRLVRQWMEDEFADVV